MRTMLLVVKQSDQLETARAALAAEEFEDALAPLLAVWQATHAPRVAAAIERVSAQIKRRPLGKANLKLMQARWMELAEKRDPADIPRLFDALASGTVQQAVKRVEVLREFPDDPRLATLLARFLANPPYARGVVFESIAKVANELIARSEPRDEPLDAATSAGLDALDELLAGARSGEDLLAAIYEAPDDDGARLVYADWLLEQGDPHGELITLQLSANRTAESAERERALIEKLGAKLAGPVAKVTKGDREFRRGFLFAVTLDPKNKRSMIMASTAREWSTVEEIRVASVVTSSLPPMTFDGPVFRSLKRLRSVPAEVAWNLARPESPRQLEVLTVERLASSVLVSQILASPGRLETLHTFGIETHLRQDAIPQIVASPLVQRITRLELGAMLQDITAWLVALAPTGIRELAIQDLARIEARRASPGAPWDIRIDARWLLETSAPGLAMALARMPPAQLSSIGIVECPSDNRDQCEQWFSPLGDRVRLIA